VNGTKRRPGRPLGSRKPEHERRDGELHFRCHLAEQDAIERAAIRAGQSTSRYLWEWLRRNPPTPEFPVPKKLGRGQSALSSEV
jgi:hypothetical protein